MQLMGRHLANAQAELRDRPLFVRGNGRFATRDHVNTLIKQLAEMAGFEPQRFSTHSMRAGGATTLALLGYEAAVIQRLGRWVSDAYRLYVHVSEDLHREATRRMATLAPASAVSRAAAARAANAAWVRLRAQL